MKKFKLIIIFVISLLGTHEIHAEVSLEEQIDIVLKMLQKNKSDLWKLSGEIDTHLKTKVTNVADRQLIGLFKILGRHQQLNEDLDKIDAKLEQAYQTWRKQNPGYHRSDWRKRGFERQTNLKLNEERNQLWSQYINDQGYYRHTIMTGKDGALKQLQIRQQQLIEERKRLTQLLRKLQIQLAELQKDPLLFHITGDLTRWVTNGSIEVVEINITRGTPPFKLEYRNGKGEIIETRINKLGKHAVKLSFERAEDGKIYTFTLKDELFPNNYKSESISFIYTGEDNQKVTKKPSNTNKKNTKIKPVPSYDEIVIKNECEKLDPKTQEWKEKCQARKSDDPIFDDRLSFEFTCGDAFELSPNEVLYPRTCDVLVKSTGSTKDKIHVLAVYNEDLIDVTFDNQTQSPRYPETRFLLIIRTRTPVPAVLTNLSIIVKHGALESQKDITISILMPEIEPSSGSGIRPPAVVETGSGGDYCVWRNKSFGDKPKCFNISTAECDNPRYSGVAKYELVGSELSKAEAALRAYTLSPYKGNLYGCDSFLNDTIPAEVDKDDDGIPDKSDNCVNIANPNQSDSDNDTKGDACDDDLDNDTIINSNDNCPTIANTDQYDKDMDGIGDKCDSNSDSDEYLDSEDNCPFLSNPSQDDLDKDGTGDACDDDLDNDTIINSNDNCILIQNQDQLDTDSDGIGDVCDVDLDGDGKRNGEDNCPNISNPDQINSDSHWQGDACQAPQSDSSITQVNCNAYPGMVPIWDEVTQSAGCSCTGDLDWSESLNKCASLQDDVLASTDCSSFGQAKAVFDEVTKRGMCECLNGYEFDSNNHCVAIISNENCAAFPGTVYINNECQCPSSLEWSTTKNLCVSNSQLAQNDVDCTAYPGSVPIWDMAKNNWKCDCIGSKQWSSSLNTCAYPEDEAVASTDCSSYPGTVAIFDDFTGQVECKCSNSSLVLSSVNGRCMTADAAAVADHNCSSYGIGAIAYLNPATNQPACKCKAGFEMNSTTNSCQSNTIVSTSTGQSVLPTPEIIKPGECNVLYDDGSDQPESYVFKVDGFSQIKLNYDTDSIKDNISVLTSSRSELWRSGCVGTGSYKSKILDLPSGSVEVIIDVHPNCDGKSSGTSWKFKAECL